MHHSTTSGLYEGQEKYYCDKQLKKMVNSPYAFGSFSSKCLTMEMDDKGLEEWELSKSTQLFCVKEKP